MVIDTDIPIRSWQLDVNFDPSKVQCTRVNYRGFLQSWAQANGGSTFSMPAAIDNVSGNITAINCTILGAIDAGGPSGTGTLCTLSFTAKPEVNDLCNINPFKTSLVDVETQDVIGITLNSGLVKIVEVGEKKSHGSGTTGKKSGSEELDLATNAAKGWLTKRAMDQFPQWKDATLSVPQENYDLEGRLICFRFAVVKSEVTLGTITIGSSLYHNTLFELNTGKLPALPSSSEVVDIAQKDLGITAKSAISEQPEKLLNLGLLDNYAVYSVDGQEIAINLRWKSGVKISDIETHIATPEQYNKYSESRINQKLDFPNWKVLDVPLRTMNDNPIPDNMQNNNNCGPTSGAMIMEYYKT